MPTNITWYGGTPPYTVGVHVGSANQQPDEVYTNISTTFFLWSTDVASNNFVVFAVGDNLTIANSDFISVQAGLTQECVPDFAIPFTSTVGGGSASPTAMKTQGAPASGSPTGHPSSTSEFVTSTTVTVSVTDSVGGTNPATPSTTNTSSASGSSHSSLSPDVIGIIVAVAVVLLIVVVWVVYKCSTRTKPGKSFRTSSSLPPLNMPRSS